MHLLAIRKPTTGTEQDILDWMHLLRAKVFRTDLSWKVQCLEGREYDEFDDLRPTYLIALSSRSEVAGCARLLPSLGPTMLGTVFPQLLRNRYLPTHC